MSERWGVIGIPVTPAGEVLVMPPLGENLGKREKVTSYQDKLKPVQGAEVSGGAVEEADAEAGFGTLQLALMREIAEEWGMIVSPNQLSMIPEGMEVEQEREGKLVKFLVACYTVNLNEKQEKWLRDSGAIGVRQAEQVRPRDEISLALYQQYAPILVQIPMMVEEEV